MQLLGCTSSVLICKVGVPMPQIYEEDGTYVSTLKATDEKYPAIGEISFFLGIPQVYTFVGE